MNLELTFKGPFVFRFRMEARRRWVSIFAPRRPDHYAHAITDQKLRLLAGAPDTGVIVASANFQLHIGYESGGGRPAIGYRPAEIVNVKPADLKHPDGPAPGSYLMKIDAPQPDAVLPLQPDPAAFEAAGRSPEPPPAGHYARGLRFYYENVDLRAGLQITGAGGEVLVDTRNDPPPPAPQSHIPVLIRYADRCPKVGGPDEDAADCFHQMGRLFPPLQRWQMKSGAGEAGQAGVFDFISDCGAPVIAIADAGTIGWNGLGNKKTSG